MEKILIIFGGKSVEHDISIITALQVMNALKGEYQILPIYVTHQSEFFTAENMGDVNIYSDFLALAKKPRKVFFDFGKSRIWTKRGLGKKYFVPASAIVCNHGLNGEDGSMSALLNLAQIPFTCPNMFSSAICMDKVNTKIILEKQNIDVCEYVFGEEIDIKKAVKKLGKGIIVKPARGGSSIGIQKCTSDQELKNAIEVAKFYDKKVLLERFIANGREFNCACFCRNGELVTSKVCEVKSANFYSFDEKYLSEKPRSSFKVEKRIATQVSNLTKEVYKILECDGVVRVDFLMDENGKLFVNEVNTIPGSLAFYLFGSMKELAIELIEQSKRSWAKSQNVIACHASNALQIFANANLNKYVKK